MKTTQANGTQLKAVSEQKKGVREDLRAAEAERDRYRAELERASDPLDRNSDAFKGALAASRKATLLTAELQDATEHEGELLRQLADRQGGAGGGRHGNGPEDLPTGDHAVAVEQLKAPGALLSQILDSRKREVATLPDRLRQKDPQGPLAMAALPTITTGNVSTLTVETEAVIDLLAPSSVAMASGIVALPINTTKARVPRFTDLPTAGWIPELGAFPKSGPGIEMVEVEPGKVGLVSGLSIEVFEDLSPLTLAMIQTQLLRSIALAYDAGILFGNGAGATPLGVANTTGIAVVETPNPLTNLSAFADAIAALFVSNARPGALVMNPLDVAALLKLVETSGGGATTSNIPLWKDAITGPSGLMLPYFKVPIWPTPSCPRRTALLYDPAEIIAVVRREADIAIDPYYNFDRGEVGLRTYLRGDVVVGQAAGVVRIRWEVPATP